MCATLLLLIFIYIVFILPSFRIIPDFWLPSVSSPLSFLLSHLPFHLLWSLFLFSPYTSIPSVSFLHLFHSCFILSFLLPPYLCLCGSIPYLLCHFMLTSLFSSTLHLPFLSLSHSVLSLLLTFSL